MQSRRAWLRTTTGAAAALGLTPRLLEALGHLQERPLIERTIPGTDERLPAIGLGSADTFSALALEEARADDFSTVRAVLRTLVDGGGRVFDTAYGYGASEQVAGQVAEELGIAERIWWSTKANAAPVAGGVSEPADPDEARFQIRRSFVRLRRRSIDLYQVHNMGDPPTQLGLLEELRAGGYVRYIGITSTFPAQYEALAEVMRTDPIDFIGVDYAVDDRSVEEVILPLALERGIGVLAYLPFGRGRMWARIGDNALPGWAADFDAHTWAQLMLKYVLAHPAVTVVCPGTSDPAHMADDLGGGRGRLPDPDQRERIIRLVDGLPEA
jgi:aryl-alcohol dehydrogenase-like predicted oxidoreductase